MATRTPGWRQIGGYLTLLALLLTADLVVANPDGSSSGTTADSLSIEMIRVEPGTFAMGSPRSEEGRSADEQQHEVTLTRSYWLGKYEVTQRQWQAVMGNNPAKIKGDEHPVEQVSWLDCVEFCNALSVREKLQPAYKISGEEVTWDRSANGYRLPTEAEWEFAARAGNTGPRSGDLDKMAIYSLNSGRLTRAVGGREPNPWGFYDIYGNVWEWCWDQYQAFEADPLTDPIGPDGDFYRTQRGGSWHRGPRDCRSASRGTDSAKARRNGLGLRLARWAQ